MLESELKSGGWVLPKLAPIFEENISSLLASKNLIVSRDEPLYVKTALNYQVIAPQDLCDKRTTSNIVNLNFGQDVSNKILLKILPRYRAVDRNPIENILTESISDKISRYDSGLGILYRQYFRHLLLVDGDDFHAASSPLLFSCLLITDRWLKTSDEKKFISTVHELAHHELFLINTLDRLITKSGEEKFNYAPLQGRERPTIGRLHSAHALYRMIQIEQYLGLDIQPKKELLTRTCATFVKTDLSDFANFLVNEIYEAHV